MRFVGSSLVAGALWLASSAAEAQVCVPGAQVACACPGGSSGVQVCADDGAHLGACQCTAPAAPTPTAQSPGPQTGPPASPVVPPPAPPAVIYAIVPETEHRSTGLAVAGGIMTGVGAVMFAVSAGLWQDAAQTEQNEGSCYCQKYEDAKRPEGGLGHRDGRVGARACGRRHALLDRDGKGFPFSALVPASCPPCPLIAAAHSVGASSFTPPRLPALLGRKALSMRDAGPVSLAPHARRPPPDDPAPARARPPRPPSRDRRPSRVARSRRRRAARSHARRDHGASPAPLPLDGRLRRRRRGRSPDAPPHDDRAQDGPRAHRAAPVLHRRRRRARRRVLRRRPEEPRVVREPRRPPRGARADQAQALRRGGPAGRPGRAPRALGEHRRAGADVRGLPDEDACEIPVVVLAPTSSGRPA